MPADDDPWSGARERARQRREARAPRTQAAKDALDAVMPMRGRGPEAIRAALVQELALRGVTDPGPEELDFLTKSVVTPRRAAGELIWRQLKTLGAAVNLFRDIARDAQPKWTVTPEDIPNVFEWRDDQEPVEVAVNARDIPDAKATLTRLFADLPHQEPAKRPAEEVRPFDCWLSCEPSNEPAAVNIHIGKTVVGDLPEQHADLARLLISRHGKDKHAIAIVAEAIGQDFETGLLKFVLPDRP